MKTGEILHNFKAKDGKTVILRTPKWEDLDDFVELINSLVDEGAEILMVEKVTRDEEADWLGKRMAAIEKGTLADIVAEVDGKVVAHAELDRQEGYSSHVGTLGIGIRDGYRDIGIRTEMINILICEGEKRNLRILTLTVFSTNKRARHVYRNAKFKETGKIPKKFYKNGKYINEIVMAREL